MTGHDDESGADEGGETWLRGVSLAVGEWVSVALIVACVFLFAAVFAEGVGGLVSP